MRPITRPWLAILVLILCCWCALASLRAAEAELSAERIAQWRKAAEKGDAKAEQNLAVVLFNGRGVEQDTEAGLKWFRKAAEQGHLPSQVRFAQLSRDGVNA